MTKLELTNLIFKKYSYEINRYRQVLKSVQSKPLWAKFQTAKQNPHVVLIVGDAGLGKTDLAVYLRQIAQEGNVSSAWIDWQDVFTRHPEMFQPEAYSVENFFEILYTTLRDLGYDKCFTDYKKNSQLIADIDRRFTESLDATMANQQVPEPFEKLRQFTAARIRHLVGTTTLGPANGFVPPELKDSIDDTVAPSIQSAAMNVARTRLNQREFDAFVNGTDCLASNLASGLREATRTRPILLVLDHSEVILRSEAWLRYLVRQAGTSVIWVIVSGDSPQVSLPEIFRNDIVLGPGLIDIQITTLSFEEVERIINSHPLKQRAATPGEVRKFFEATNGNLLAVNIAMDLWYPGNPAGIEVLEPPQQRSKVVTPVFERYLFSALSRPEDKHALSVLAFCFSIDKDLLSVLLGGNAEALVSSLIQKYPYLFDRENSLTSSARFWLREQLLQTYTQREFQLMAKRALDWWYIRLRELEEKNEDFVATIDSDQWRLCAIAAAYHCFWLEESGAYEILLNILRSLVFLSSAEASALLESLFNFVGPLAGLRPRLCGLIDSFEQGILQVVQIRDLPETVTSLKFENGSLVDDRGKVWATVGIPTMERALETLESTAEPTDLRVIAVQVAKARFLSLLGNFVGAYAALESARKSAITIPAHSRTSKYLAGSYRKLGQALMRSNGAPRLALECFSKAIDLDDESPVLLSELAIAYHNNCEYQQAIVVADKALAKDPDLGIAYNTKGGALNALRRYEEAIDVFSEGLRRKITAADVVLLSVNIGIVYLNLGHYDEAEAALDKALAIQPENSAALVAKSMLIQHKDPARVLVEVRKAVELSRYLDAYFINSVRTLVAQADDNSAIEILESMITGPKRVVASPYVMASLLYAIGERYLNLRQWQAALKHADGAVTLMPRFLPAYTLAARAHRELRHYEEARASILRALEVNVTDTSRMFIEALSNVGETQGDRQIERRMHDVPKSQKGSVEASIQSGLVELLVGKLDKAQFQMRQAARQNPDDYFVHFVLGVVELSLENIPAATRCMENAIIRLPEGRRGFVYYSLARIYDGLNRVDEAIESLQKSAEEYEMDLMHNMSILAFVQYDLARLLYRVGREEEACKAFEQSIISDPDSYPGHLSRIILLMKQGEHQEAKLELRRLERDLDWESEKQRLTSSLKWRSQRVRDMYYGFTIMNSIMPVLQGALLAGDRSTAEHITKTFDLPIDLALKPDDPIYQLSSTDWTAAIPEIAGDYAVTVAA